MQAIVVKEFTRRGEIQKVGAVIEIPIDAILKLAGFVEVAPAATEESLMQMVRDASADLDALRDWTDWRKALTPDRRQRLKEIESRIDSTYAELDRPGLSAALTEFRTLCLTVNGGMQ
jgi:hypothetical protein